MDSHVLSGATVLSRMVDRLPGDQRRIFDAAVRSGFIVLRPEEQELRRVWAVWCMQQRRPDVRIENNGALHGVTMHLGTAHCSLSGDGMIAIRRAFERYGDQVAAFQTRTWCKHPSVASQASQILARRLVEIAYLDGVAEPE